MTDDLDAIMKILDDNAVDELHSWRCKHPDRYGPCSCKADLADELAAFVAKARTAAWGEARAAVERQTNLPDLVYFDKPSDFRKGVLSSLVALDNARGER